MSLLPFMVVSFGGAAAALLTKRWPRVSLAIGLVGLALATVAALAIIPGDGSVIGSGQLEATEFGRLFLVLGASTGLVLVLVALATEWRPDLPAGLLGGFGALAVALAIGDPIDALLAVLAGSLGVTLLSVAAPVTARDVTVASREFRAIVVAGALAIVGMAWIDRPVGTPLADPTVYGLAFLAVALGAAIRFGAIPFHRWAARLADAAPGPALPLLLAWAPAAFAVVALAWMDRSVAPLLLPLDVERALLVTVAALTIVLGAVGAWLQDDLEHVVGYSILQDAGFIILGLAILDPAAWQPTRAWILIFVVVKTAFAAWAIALRTRFDTRRIPELGGWARRAPSLAVSLLLIVVATIGVPGLLSWDVRSDLIRLSLGSGPMALLVLLGGVASLAYYGRIAVAGAAAPSTLVAAGADERPKRPTPEAPGGSGPSGVDRVVAAGQANLAPIASAGVLVLAVVALAIGVGGLGGREAAAAPAPDPGAPTETYLPLPSEGSPGPSEGGPSVAPSGDAATSAEPDAGSPSPDQTSPTPSVGASPESSTPGGPSITPAASATPLASAAASPTIVATPSP
jgi:NADH-quinone oxidoreductase subunit N